MANNPYVNKVVFGNNTVIDISDSTAVASDVAQGKYFYLATGEKAQGTATGGGSGGNVWQDAQGYVHLDDEGTTPITVEPLSVTQNGTYTATTGHAYSPVTVNVSGGGGLVYETGTWTPSEDVASYVISFSNTHTEAPFCYQIMDVTGTYSGTTNAGVSVEYFNFNQLFGAPYYEAETTVNYGVTRIRNRTSSATTTTTTTINLVTPHTSTSSSSTSQSRYWATETGIKAYTNSSTRYWRSGRTYKWIAVWAPTT